MKAIKVLSLIFAAVLIFSSCNNETAEPTITWDGNLSKTMDFAIEDNYVIDLSVVVDAEAGIKSFAVNKYVYTGEDYTLVSLTAPTGYVDLATFSYDFTETIDETDFPDGVTKIVFEFEITDNEDRVVSKDFTVFVIAYYTLTFDVKDAFDAAVADASVTIGDSTYTAGVYAIDVEVGTYTYSVAKTGYQTVTVADFEVSVDQTIDVMLNQELSVYSDTVLLALEGQQAWATYNGTAVPNFQSNDIGVAFTYTDAGIGRITTTANCDGWVVIDDVSTVADYYQLVNAYTGGTPVTQLDLLVDQRVYAEKYFVAKIGTEYKLVHYILGHRSATTGNIVGFKYKTKSM
jgi:hypothetical protein